MLFQVFTTDAFPGEDFFELIGERTLVGTFEAQNPNAAIKASARFLIEHNITFVGQYAETDVPCTCAHILTDCRLAIVVPA